MRGSSGASRTARSSHAIASGPADRPRAQAAAAVAGSSSKQGEGALPPFRQRAANFVHGHAFGATGQHPLVLLARRPSLRGG
jgi:hypothetical protein